jgi:NADH dehydrogenase
MRKNILPKDYPELDSTEIDIHLVQGGPCLLAGMSEEASAAALKYLDSLGVEVHLNARVIGYDGERLQMKDGSSLAAKKVIWAAGIIGNTLPGLPAEAYLPGRRLQVDRLHRVACTENIFALGDLAYMTEEAYPHGHPQVAQVAIQQAGNLADNFLRMKNGKQAQPFHYKDLGAMATIGRRKAVVDLPYWKFQGAFAWLVWLFVHLLQLIGFKNKVFVFINWVWNYFTYDQSLRLIIRPRTKN